jgi:hypothetical protein
MKVARLPGRAITERSRAMSKIARCEIVARRAQIIVGPRVSPPGIDLLCGAAAGQERGLELGERGSPVERGPERSGKP